ncbi:MAG: hypothetical protein ABSF26_01675 [Thermoguttaceae bacterium]
MKRAILPAVALALVVVLGLLAIAYAQRNAGEPAGNEPANPLRVDNGPTEPATAPANVPANPLRPATVSSPPPKMPVDPFGLRADRLDVAVRPAAGEATAPSVPPPPVVVSDRRAGPVAAADRYGNAGLAEGVDAGPRLDAPQGQEPARFQADPSALPASSQALSPVTRHEVPPGAGPPGTTGLPLIAAAAQPQPGQVQGNGIGQPPSGLPLVAAAAQPQLGQAQGSGIGQPPSDTPRGDGTGQPQHGQTHDDGIGKQDKNLPQGEGTGQPGGKNLEGPQTQQLTIQKLAPPEVQIGKPAVLRVTVRNAGTVAVGSVEIHDQVPRGTRLLTTTPVATSGPQGEVLWSLGTLKPNEELSVEMRVMPTAEGQIGSVATVHFGADASARSVATRPRLTVETTGASRVLLGDEVGLCFVVSNPGTGVATGVVLEEHIPAGLQHPAGGDLEYAVGDLKPGESRKLELKLKATRPGAAANVVRARADASLRSEHRFDLEVLSPQLDIALAGPKRRYLEREAAYQLSVLNPGTAPAQQVELAAYLPQGMRFVRANNSGYYDEPTRAVYWRLAELPANEKGTVELVALPVEPGQQSIRVRGSAQRGLSVEKQQPVVVEGLAAVLFDLSHTKEPIEVGGETTYAIHVGNQGSKAAGNVRLIVMLPPEMKPLSAEGPTRFTMDSSQVVFDGLAQLAPKTDVTYKVRAQGLRPGDLRVRCQLLTDEMKTPVTKEESTRVYTDE